MKLHIEIILNLKIVGSKIKIETSGPLHYMSESDNKYCHPLHAKCGTSSMSEFTSSVIGSADLVVYLCHDTTTGDGYRGVAARSTACTTSSRRCSINEYQSSKALFAEVSSLLSIDHLPRKYNLTYHDIT